jgi:WD40 repeat protein
MHSNLPTPVVADPVQTRQVKELKHARPLFACRFDPAGRFAVAGAQGNDVARWEIASDKKTDLVGHQSWVRAMTFSPRGERLVTGDYAGRVTCWSYADDAPRSVWTAEAHRGWVRAASASPDGELVATAGNDNLVRLRTIEHGTPVREFVGHDCHVYNTLFDPTGAYLVSADLKGRIKHWEVATGRLVRDLNAAELHKYDGGFRADIGGARGMAFSPDGRYLACSGITEVTNAFAGVGQPLVVLIDWHTGQRKALLKPKDAFQGVAWGIAFHPNGFLVGVGGGGGGGILWFWNPAHLQPFHSVKLPQTAYDVALHPSGLELATAHYDGSLRIHAMTPKV